MLAANVHLCNGRALRMSRGITSVLQCCEAKLVLVSPNVAHIVNICSCTGCIRHAAILNLRIRGDFMLQCKPIFDFCLNYNVIGQWMQWMDIVGHCCNGCTNNGHWGCGRGLGVCAI